MNSGPPEPGAGAQPAQNRRTRGLQRRRSRLYEAAIELIISRGFDNTTMDEIAERADVARATVFNHFERKTAFIDEWAARRRDKAMHAVYASHAAEVSVREILRICMREFARVSVETREETVALMSAAVHLTNVLGNPPLGDMFASFLARAKEDGQVPESTDAKLVGLLLATGYFAVLTAWIEEEPAPFDLESRLLSMLDVIFDGVEPATGEADSPSPPIGIST